MFKKAPWYTVSDATERLRAGHVTFSTVVPGRCSRHRKRCLDRGDTVTETSTMCWALGGIHRL